MISGSLAERDLQLMATYAFSPPCTLDFSDIVWVNECVCWRARVYDKRESALWSRVCVMTL